MTNQEIKRTAEKALTNVFGIYGTNVDRNINNESNDFNDIEVDEDKQRVQINAIFLWKWHRYSIKSIATKLSITKEKVNQILSLYRTNVKKSNE